MKNFRNRVPALAVILAVVAVFPALAEESGGTAHATTELVRLAGEIREFRSPLFRARTWRANSIGDEVPDYAAVVEDQVSGLAELRRRLNALDPVGWPVHDQVDFLLLRAELDDVYFEHHILREVETNAGFYIDQAIDGVAREMGDVVPYSEDRALAIIAAFERTDGIVRWELTGNADQVQRLWNSPEEPSGVR